MQSDRSTDAAPGAGAAPRQREFADSPAAADRDEPTLPPSPGVSVIITARNAAGTIGDAVTSALEQPETRQVIVVDDASTDATSEAAGSTAAGDPRLVLIRNAVNLGPAAARNLALDRATGDLVAVLDADDFYLPGRFARLTRTPGWEMIADNILFVAESAAPCDLPPIPTVPPRDPIPVDLAAFVRANHSSGKEGRREWGFLKPLMRIDFLRRHGLRYDETLRLGEDYDLYVRMLHAGARVLVDPAVGYVARWRDDSLSSRHRTADLEALHAAARRHLRMPGLSAAAQNALRVHADDLRQRHLLREALDIRRTNGRAGAMSALLRQPGKILPVVRGVLADKLGTPHARPSRIGRLLIDP